MANFIQLNSKSNAIRFVLWATLMLVAVALLWIVVKICVPAKPRYSFHKPATVFDSKTGKIYEISADEKTVVEFDVVNGKKIRRTLSDGEKWGEIEPIKAFRK